MPNRVIKESIKRSEQIDSLTWFEEVVFYRLLVSADDYGCADGRIMVLKNDLFPLKENVTKKSIQDAIAKLTSAGLLRPYEVNGKPYLFFPTWEKHQRVRNKRRKYPDPPNLTASCCQLSASCCQTSASCQPESESESESNTNTTPPIIPPTVGGIVENRCAQARVVAVGPSEEECVEFCKRNSIETDARQFYKHFSALGWIVGEEPVKNWRALLLRWAKEHPLKESNFDTKDFWAAAVRRGYAKGGI